LVHGAAWDVCHNSGSSKSTAGKLLVLVLLLLLVVIGMYTVTVAKGGNNLA
jgi:hypothetical protein